MEILSAVKGENICDGRFISGFPLCLKEEEGNPHLPGCQTGRAHQVPAGLDLHVFVVLSADLAELESGAHLAVQLVLLLQGAEGGGALEAGRAQSSETAARHGAHLLPVDTQEQSSAR